MSYQNIWHNIKRKPVLFGFYPHSYIMQKKSMVSIPYFKNDPHPILAIVLQSYSPKQSGTVTINGTITKNIVFKNNKALLIHKLDTSDLNKINIEFNFDSKVVKYLNRKNRLLRIKSECSTILLVCNFYTLEDLEATQEMELDLLRNL